MKTNRVASKRQQVECGVCHFTTEFTSANVLGDEMMCVSCGEPIAEITRITQNHVDVMRCTPFAAALADVQIGGE